jgi:hypothetical protein
LLVDGRRSARQILPTGPQESPFRLVAHRTAL